MKTAYTCTSAGGTGLDRVKLLLVTASIIDEGMRSMEWNGLCRNEFVGI